MTDEEMKRLEEDARDVKATSGVRPPEHLWTLSERHVQAKAAAVLALIERVRKAEARAERGGEAKLQPALDIIREPLKEMGCTFPGGGFVGIAEGIREVVAKAERKGAEEMRKAIVVRLRETARGYDEVAEMLAGDVKATTDRLRLCARAWEDEDAAEDILTLRLPGDAP